MRLGRHLLRLSQVILHMYTTTVRRKAQIIQLNFNSNCTRSQFWHRLLHSCTISAVPATPCDTLLLWRRHVLHVGRIAEDRTNCELIAKEEAAIQQLVLMALSENQVVVKQACKTIGEAGPLKCGERESQAVGRQA